MTQKDFVPILAALKSTIIIAVCTVFAFFLRHLIDPVDLSMIYLVGVVFTAARYGTWPSVFASLLAVCAFNFLFVEPYYTFSVTDDKYYVTFIFLLATSLIVSSVASKLKRESENVQRQNIELQALYEAASAFAACRGHQSIAKTAIYKIEKMLPVRASLWSGDDIRDIQDEAVKWSYVNGEACGRGAQTFPSSQGYYLPLIAQGKAVGVLNLIGEIDGRQTLVAAYASLIASAIARADSAKLAEEQGLEAEREKLRNTLLSAVGHDLRTPLASIMGAASSLAEQSQLPPQAAELAHSIHGEASRLNKLVRNLLDVTRMESGALSLNRQPYFVNELIGSALQSCKESLDKRNIELSVEKDLPLLSLDGLLVEQVLINLLENAARYTPEHGNIYITATQTPYAIELSVADFGIGIPAGSELTIFERYKRLSEKKTEGMGLGLAICKGIVEAHGGNIWVRNRAEGGALFTFTLPFHFNKITLSGVAA